MAKQVIDLGTVDNDGTGDSLKVGGDKVNDNFTENYDDILEIQGVHGWGYYKDAGTTPATLSITTTASKIQIDGAGANSETSYLPLPIRGSGDLWDVTNDKITPILEGDSYTLRVDLTITAKTGGAGTIYLQLDIGGGAAPTIIIAEEDIAIAKTVPFSLSIPLPIFCLSTFVANGGQLFLTSDTGTVTISDRAISIYRISSGVI